MNYIAFRMLIGDRAKYFGLIFGIFFTSLIMSWQPSIFVGLMSRTFSFISDLGYPDIWVMDPTVRFIDDSKPLQDTALLRVRGVPGVKWAVPMYKGILRARLQNGAFQQVNVIGIDDATLIGGPPVMIEGRLEDLRRADAVIVDIVGASTFLAKPGPIDPTTGEATRIPLAVGDTLELNDRRAVVVGLCRTTRTFQSQPVVFTTYSRAIQFAPSERRMLSFVLAESDGTIPPKELAVRISEVTGLKALTGDDFKTLTLNYFLKNTGIPINFGISTLLGFVVGLAIAGQTFYGFVHDNMKNLGALKAMGASNWLLLRMILLQAMVVGLVGYGLGVGASAMFGFLLRNSPLAFMYIWQVMALSAGGVAIICFLSSLIAIQKVWRLEPAIVFKG